MRRSAIALTVVAVVATALVVWLVVADSAADDPVYREVVAEVSADPRVVERVGEPVEVVEGPQVKTRAVHGPNVNTETRVVLAGPKGRGELTFRTFELGPQRWPGDVEFRVADGEAVDLDDLFRPEVAF